MQKASQPAPYLSLGFTLYSLNMSKVRYEAPQDRDGSLAPIPTVSAN